MYVCFVSLRIQIYPCTDSGSIESSSSMYSWISYSWSYAGSYLVPVIPQDWGLSLCQIYGSFLFLASMAFLSAVGHFARSYFGCAAGNFAQSVVVTYFLSTCLVIPDIHRLLFIQAIMSIGAFACVTGMCWSARRSLKKTPGTLPSSALVCETLLPIDDVNTFIELTPIIPVIVTIIGMIQSA
jgi:hypothetical protein